MSARALGPLLALALAGTAHAGAWPREEGTFFVSSGAEAFPGEGAAPTFYLEFGLTPRLTIGADGWLNGERTEGAAYAFARLPLSPADSSNRFAAGLGFGALLTEDATPAPATRATLHWGRGLETGWLAIDAALATALTADASTVKLDATWGRRLTDDWTAIVMATMGTDREGQNYITVSPSLAWQATGRATLRLGASHRLSGEGSGVAAQLWLTF